MNGLEIEKIEMENKWKRNSGGLHAARQGALYTLPSDYWIRRRGKKTNPLQSTARTHKVSAQQKKQT